MPLVWSSQQVRSGIIRTVVNTFNGRHLPWCESSVSDCSCFGKKREKMLTTFATAVADENKAANEMYMRVIYGI